MPLVTGDPRDRRESAASFSRFVLPFAYLPCRLEPSPADSGPVYRQLRIEEPARWSYLTLETGKALFRDAEWWRLEARSDSEEAGFRFHVPRRDGGEYVVALAAPLLVLFELSEARRRALKDPRGDLLASGFLLVDLSFPDLERAPTFEDLLRLNEMFRYWRAPYEGHAKYYDALLCGLREACSTSERVGEAELYTGLWTSLLQRPLEAAPDVHLSLYPKTWDTAAHQRMRKPFARIGEDWAVHADNRTFVWTCAVVDGGVAALKERYKKRSAITLGHWIKLVNVDRPGTDPEASTAFERRWVTSRTYDRWAHQGTVYGFTYHSGAMLAPVCLDPPLCRHFAGMYFDQVLLLLYLRLTVFRFSHKLSEVTSEARSSYAGGGDTGWLAAFQELRRDFVFFTNKYQFPLLSHQQQGLEMYTCARRGLEVEELFREVEQEVQNTHDYFQTQASQKLAEMNTRLAVGAGVSLPLAIVAGFLGMNLFGVSGDEPGQLATWGTAVVWFLGALVVAVGLVLGFMRWPRLVERFLLPRARGTRR